MAKTVKMSDIAERLNVSTVTVSKALSDQKGVSDEMRNKIKKLALEMGYQKPISKPEDRVRSYNVGVIVPDDYIEKYQTFYWEMYQEINMAAVKNNSFVMLEVLNAADEKAGIPPKLLKENKIDGLIVLGGLKSAYLKMIKEHYATPTVYLDFYDQTIKEDCVISNSFYGTYTLTNHLFDKGHTNIGFVGTVLATKSITDRYLGYMKSLLEHDKTVREDWVLDDRDRDRHNFHKFELPEEMPTAFVCNCDSIASWFIRELEQNGYRVPEDISIVGFDDFLYPGLCNVPMTTYAVNMTEMAETGVKLLITKMTGGETSEGMHLIEGRFIERKSVRAI
ncbi:MAG: LacI family DNA-binding transcriptional regulator [Lachnospiraceae bacterium]|nr:LacI family DNA-binding transcriptional regulator [Lachnospiraceae bacterium]